MGFFFQRFIAIDVGGKKTDEKNILVDLSKQINTGPCQQKVKLWNKF